MFARVLLWFAALSSLPLIAQEYSGWEWHAVDGSVCRDGSEAGYFLKKRPFDNRVAILLEGGGACFNLLTCKANPHTASDTMPRDQGLFADRDDNPMQGWSQIFVPYCTGDIFSGSRSDVTITALKGRQQFRGADNIKLILEDVAQKMPDMERLVLSGVSAGGFGAIMNYATVRTRFPDVPVTLLDDSGLPLEDEFVDPCLQKRFRDTWNLSDAFPQDCDECRAADGGGLIKFTNYIRENYPDQQQGVILSEEDSTLRFFFGYSRNKCMTLVPSIPAATYKKGIASARANYLRGSIKSFIVPGSQHTFIYSNLFYSQRLGGQTMASWVADLIQNRAVNRP